MVTKGNLILDESQIKSKIKRIAYEIYEDNFKEKKLVVAGIEDRGYKVAQSLATELTAISTIEVLLVKVSVDKKSILNSNIELDCDTKLLRNKSIILVDDVLNTGKTLAYSLKPFLNLEIKKLVIAVLVNRSHILFPIMATYTGYELSTTINEHIDVNIEKSPKGVYLN